MEINNMIEMNETIPFAPTHPTEIIKDEIKARGMSKKELADRMGMKSANLSRFLKGENITPAIAAKLESALDIPADMWLKLQVRYDKDTKAVAQRDEREKIAISSELMLSALLCLPQLYKELKINSALYIQDKLKKLEELLGFNPINIGQMAYIQQSCYKKSDKLSLDKKEQNTWLTLAYIKALENPPVQPYQKGRGVEAAKIIAAQAHQGILTEAGIKQILSNNGISYSVVKKLEKTPIDAASMQTGKYPAIITTHRYNDMSRLIFNVLHEIGHIEKHICGDGSIFISSDETYSIDNPQEQEANTFAENMLIDKQLWNKMMKSEVNSISTRNIIGTLKRLSQKYELDFNIVVWRYKYESRNYRLYGAPPLHIK